MKIKTNGHTYDLMYYQDLTPKELKQFENWDMDKLGIETFIRYKGDIYVLSDFSDCKVGDYKGIYQHNEFSGVLIKVINFHHVKIASYTV